jgi:divalent metal cation (Fe/Co/Zn/Cd) transporter
MHASLSLDKGNEGASATRATQRITYVGGAVNLGMAVGTAAVGLASGSSSLMAHAVSQLCL